LILFIIGGRGSQLTFLPSPSLPRDDRYALRQILYEEVRKTELFIVLTMVSRSSRDSTRGSFEADPKLVYPLSIGQYNEDDELFLRTLRGCMQNIDYLCTKSKSKTWNQNGWQKVRRSLHLFLSLTPLCSLKYASLTVWMDPYRSSSASSAMDEARSTLARSLSFRSSVAISLDRPRTYVLP
jgi:hypothetical protein